jgi:hypothetical protein
MDVLCISDLHALLYLYRAHFIYLSILILISLCYWNLTFGYKLLVKPVWRNGTSTYFLISCFVNVIMSSYMRCPSYFS